MARPTDTVRNLTVYRAELTAGQYRELVECKYRAALKGWALIDQHGTVHAWHEVKPGDHHWATATAAMQAFLPDTRTRLWRQRLGWTVHEDPDRYWLCAFLTALRTGNPQTDGGEQ